MVIDMPNHMKTIILLAAAAGLAATVSYAERIYHWTDTSGVAHLTQHPPPAEGRLNDVMDYTSSDQTPAKTERNERRKGNYENEEPMQPGTETYQSEKMEQAVAEDNYCYLQAPDIDVYVRVWAPDTMVIRDPNYGAASYRKTSSRKSPLRTAGLSMIIRKNTKDLLGAAHRQTAAVAALFSF